MTTNDRIGGNKLSCEQKSTYVDAFRFIPSLVIFVRQIHDLAPVPLSARS